MCINGKLPSAPILITQKLPLKLNEEWSIDVKVAGDRLSGKLEPHRTARYHRAVCQIPRSPGRG